MVVNRAVTFISHSTPASLGQKELDLDSCYREDEIVVQVYAASLNPVDLLVHSFACWPFIGSYEKTYSRDYSGVIVKRGDKVDPKWKVGDKVNGFYNHVYGYQGSLTDYLVLNPKQQSAITHMPKPADSKYGDFIVNAAWPLVFGTAYSALFNYGQKLGPESKILIIGASTSVSYAMLQIAKHELGVKTVVGVCSSKSIEYNKKLGYDYLATYDQGPIIESVGKILVGDLNNEKFDLIFDSVGNSEFFPVMDKFLKPKKDNSYYISIAGDRKINYSNPRLTDTFSTIVRVLRPFKSYNYATFFVKSQSDYMELGSKMITEGTYEPIIDSVYPLEDFQTAIDKQKSNRAKGKIVIKVKNDL
ncbi:hypothetical protein HG537_0A02950 [Torulaspora globosa]|uniref:Enoyl reductase (ER) domain-containing protein n=1 Tax=Torulaspora globosa TaxID=48254 RepID=A0A7H9HJI1_9SACH|nr:hypothetical protein HG537_0A02950 [Torulaspora sp. CBS 2947]